MFLVILGKLILAQLVKKSPHFVEPYCVHESPPNALYNVLSLEFKYTSHIELHFLHLELETNIRRSLN
jgi:hypothetical protein